MLFDRHKLSFSKIGKLIPKTVKSLWVSVGQIIDFFVAIHEYLLFSINQWERETLYFLEVLVY